MKLSTLFLPAALAGSPGVEFFTGDGDYWPVLACESDKACSIWKIAQKPGFEDSRAARLTCDLSINKCVCADGFVDKNNDPMDGCEEETGAGSDGESCYFGTCSDDASCESFQPGLRCGSNGCCECDPSSISSIGNQKGCLTKPESEPEVAEADATPRNNCPIDFVQVLSDPITCCHQNAYYDSKSHSCMCGGQEVDEDGFCKECPKGSSLWNTENSGTECCPHNTVWSTKLSMCICQDLTIPGANGLEPNECPGDCPKSPYWTKLYWSEDEGWFCLPQGASYNWDPNTCRDQVQCPDQFGNWQTVDSSVGKCSVCPPGFREFEVFNGIECCPGQSTYNETLGTCFCQDGVNKPDMFTNECPGDCPAGTTLGSLYPEITCCPPGTSFVDNNGFVGCACDNLSPPTAPDVDGNCPFCATNHHKQKKDNGVEVCCPKNHVWSDIMQKCACPNGAEDQGYGCPGDCPTGEYLYGYSLDGDSLCCPVGSWFDNSPCEQRCRCDYGWNGGTGPEPNAGDTPHPERGCYYCSSELVPFVSPGSSEPICCPEGQYSFGGSVCLCQDGQPPGPRGECYGECDPGFYLSETWNPDLQKNVKSCCPIGSELQYNSPALVCFCTNSGNEATSMNSCTGCAQNEVPFWMNHDDTTCCPENRRYFNFAGCQCSDGSMPHGWTGCDGDCPAGWYLAGPAPERECCPIGSDYDNDLKKCICQTGNYINMEPQIVDGESTCVICPQSMTVHYDNGKNIHCCGQNHQFDGQSCVCKNGDPPGANGECNGDCPPGTTYQSNEFGVICCPNDGFTGFNNMNGICMCENGIEADMENYVCPPCPDGLTSFTDMYDNIQCCPANQHWSDNQMGCVCSDGQYPFGDGQCNGDCPWLFNFAKNKPELLCCPANSFYDQDREKCICNPPGMFLDAGISPDPDTHLCPYCGSFDTMYEGKNGPMCCPNNMVYDEINDGCTCPDGSQSWPTNYGPPQCPGDCPAGEYLAHRTLDEKFCCQVGSTPTINGYDDVTCTCFDNNPPDPVNGCPTPCGPGLVPWDDSYNGNQQIACCPPGKIWYPWRNECMCNGEYLGYNNACEGDCSPGWYKWSEDLCCAVGGSMMWDGSADVCKCPGGTSPNSETGCGFCSNKEIAYRKRDGSEICCQKNMKFNYQSDQCECEGQPLTPTFSPATCKGDCPVGKWIQFKDSGEMICCAIGSWWDESFQKCMCPDQNEADPDTGCSMCAVDEQIYFDNSGNTRCCRTNQYFDLSWDECRCMDGTRPYNSQCPGDCEVGEVMEQFYPEKICCPIGAYWNANAEECLCFNGALVDNRCEVNDCAQMDIALITADGVKCCPKNQIWHEGNCRCPDKTNPGSSYNTQGGNGDYNPHPQECPGDCPYGQRFFLDNKGDIVCCPGETGYSAITDTCTCPNGGTYDYENNKCPFCNNNREKEWTDPSENIMCCTLNLVLTDYSCTCEDGSNPNQNMECPGDCPQEEYLADILGGQLKCCPVGSSLQMMNGVQTSTCICDQTGNEPDVETGCNLCNSNQIAFQTGGQWSSHKCCASNLIYSPNANDCTCSNGLPPNGDGSCPGDCAAGFFFVGGYSEVICCPLGSAYNSALEQCQCPDGSEAGDSPCPLCPTHMSSHWASNGEEKCCYAHTEWSQQLDDCACSDGSFLGPFMMCEDTCAQGEYLAQPHPFQCCPLGSVFEEGECKCSDGRPLDSTYCGQCPENSNAFLDFDDGMTKCCPGNQKWVNSTMGCVCEDESMPLAFGSCPGDCDDGMFPAGINSNNTLICCPDGAYLNSGECLCNSGSPVIDNTCPPCPPNRTPYYDDDGNLMECCLESHKYLNDTNKCICKDDSLPGYNDGCPGECGSPDLFVFQRYPEFKCCKAGEYYDQGDEECKCSDPNESNINNNACGYCGDGVYNPAMKLDGGVECCAVNHQYSYEHQECRCPNGDQPFGQYGGCPGDCDPGQIVGYVDPTDTLDPIKCCPEDSWYDIADKLCKCNSGFAIVNDTCPYCPEHKDVYFDASQNPQCCHKNQMFDQGVGQCICKSDGTIPGYGMNCPNDCDGGEWLGSFEPLECCEIGAKWTSDLGCHCTDGAPLNGTGCGECSDNEIVGFNKDNGAIICCKSNQIFSNSSYECLCPENNSPPWQNGECPGDCEPGFFFASNIDEVLCCPNDASYDSWMNACICNNGGIYDPDTGCPPCSPPLVLQTDINNQTQCCQINQVVTTYGACMCEDGSYPDGPMYSCGDECIDYGDGYWLQSVYPTIECCPLNSYWSEAEGKCFCPDYPDEIPDETGCGKCSISQRTHLDQNGVVQCCEKNEVWFDEDDYTVAGCYCKDGSNSEPNGECPGDCPEDKVFIQAFPRTICCEIGSVYDPIGDECMCTNGDVVDDTACGFCSNPGERALLDENGNIRCCERNQIWIADENIPAGGHCRCKDGSQAINLPPSYFPQCGDECEEGTYFVGANHPTLGCCPYGTQYNSLTDECECPNNNVVEDTACGECSSDQKAHMDEFGNVKCCKRNLFWYDGEDTGPGGCFCDNRTEPFYASSWSTYQQCEIDCEENHVIQFVEPYVQCCPFNSEWNYNLNKCVCDNGDEPDDRACGNCAQPDRAIFDSLGNIQCCQRNLFYFEQDMSGPPGCFCADRSQPLYLTNSMYGECPNDCGEGEYFVRPDPKTICCPLGAEYDNQTKTCKCKFDEPMVDGKCPVCPTGQNPHLDSSFMIQCCDEGFIWIDSLPSMNKCACPGGSTTLPCPPLIQPEQSLCPGDLQYNFNKGECECWDGQAPVDGECNSNTCQDGETAYNNRFGDIMCCPKNTYFKKDRDMCVCTGDLLPTPNGDCPVCAPQETPYVYADAAGCCPENSYFDQGMLQCKCFFDSTIVEENTVCSPACPPHQIFFKDGGWGNCEDFCQQGQIYNTDSNTCLCPEGHIVGKDEQCPGIISNCNFDFLPIETENGQVCCHKDAHYSPAHERCICNDGSEPNANQVCSSSCPDGLVYAMYAQSGKMACLCPDTFQYPNVNGICLSSICRTNDVVINFEDGSFACCPVGSTWSSKWNMCICIHQGTLGQCGEKCPDGQISVYNDFNAETECQFVSPCQPGEIQDLAGNCCPQGEVYNDELNFCECPEGQVVIGGSCASPCPEGSKMEAGSCVSKCPEEQIYKDEECYCADGSLASLTKPCCELGQHWSAEKSLCVCDGGDSCNQVCPDSLPNQFLDVFGKLHCCASDQVFNVREQKCMCMGSFESKKFADPVDGKCSCPGMKQVITDGAFTCEPSVCSPSQIFSPITALCECPADKYPFENEMSGEIECCPAGQKWSNTMLMCICIEGNMLPNPNGVCEEVEECPPGWYFSGKTHEYGQILTECLPACPDPAMVWFVDSETAANVTSVSCKCKGEFKYTLSTDVPMTNYVTDGWCEPEECPVGMIRSEDVSNFNECVCPYHWQTITDNGGCSCDHPHYSMFFNTCTCKEKVFAYQVFGADGTCQCPIGMAYDPETFGCREDCYFFGEDPSTGEDKCMTKEEFEAAYTANPTPNPLTQIDDECPGFEVGWKGIKSSRVTLRSSNDNVNSYQILTNVRDNQNNVDVTKDDYIGFLVWSKRHCGYAFIEQIIQGGVTISMWDQSDIYKLQQAYLSQDKSQTQTVLQFKVQHNRDSQGNIIGGNLMVDGKKDQFYLNINVDSSLEFAYGEEYCLTSFNVGVMKSAMDFGENYTYCVPNGGSYWWGKPSNPSLTRDSNQSD